MYQGAHNFYGRYADVLSKSVECIYDLTPKPLLFIDPGLVYPGMIIWHGRDGKPHPLHAGAGYYGNTRLSKDDIVGVHYRTPSGVVFEAQPAERGPEIEAWRDQLGGGTLLHQDGVYRFWSNAKPGKEFEGLPTWDETGGFDLTSSNIVLRYFESDNGIDWRSPDLDFVKPGGRKTNIVFGSMFTKDRRFSGLVPFYDPSAPGDSRFKAFYTGTVKIPELLRVLKERGQKLDPLSVIVKLSQLEPDSFSNPALYYDSVFKGKMPDDFFKRIFIYFNEMVFNTIILILSYINHYIS